MTREETKALICRTEPPASKEIVDYSMTLSQAILLYQAHKATKVHTHKKKFFFFACVTNISPNPMLL